MKDTFKVGDKVRLKPENELRYPDWKYQENGVGIITAGPDNDWFDVTWENSAKYSYRSVDLVKIKESTMPDYKITEAFLKDLHSCGCMPDVKKALEKNFPGVFGSGFSYKAGEIFLSKNDDEPYVCKSREAGLIALHTGHHHNLYDDDQNKALWRPMRSGTITVTVKDGKVAGATVQED